VRFTLDGTEVRIEWLRGGAIVRHQRLSRADIEEIELGEMPSSDGDTMYRLVVTMKNRGEIALSEEPRASQWTRYAREKGALLASFLGVPGPRP
jgi:hypothetical protein